MTWDQIQIDDKLTRAAHRSPGGCGARFGRDCGHAACYTPATTYTVTATKAGQSVSTTFTLPTNGSVANVTLNLPVGTMNATVRWGAAGPFSNGAAITVTTSAPVIVQRVLPEVFAAQGQYTIASGNLVLDARYV